MHCALLTLRCASRAITVHPGARLGAVSRDILVFSGHVFYRLSVFEMAAVTLTSATSRREHVGTPGWPRVRARRQLRSRQAPNRHTNLTQCHSSARTVSVTIQVHSIVQRRRQTSQHVCLPACLCIWNASQSSQGIFSSPWPIRGCGFGLACVSRRELSRSLHTRLAG